MKKRLSSNLLLRLILGILAGMLIGSSGTLFGIQDSLLFTGIVRLFATFTSLFTTFLNFLIPLLILSFVSVGLAELGQKANRLFGATLLLAYFSTVLAGFLSFFLGKAVLPALVKPISSTSVESAVYNPFLTIEAAPVFGVMTALILAFLLGLGMANLKGEQGLLSVLQNLQSIISGALKNIVIPLIPVHIAGLFCNIAASGKLLATIRIFVSLFLLILIVQWLYTLFQFLLSSLICRENLLSKLKTIVPAYFTALGTQSSAATIPVNLECAKKNGISDEISDFVIPLCATIHLSGDTICLVLGSMGILLANGMTPTLTMFTPFIFMLGITMVAAPGVPGGGVMAALGLISSMLGFTEPMQQLIISLHFSQDSFGTAANITGDQAIALVVDKLDRRKNSRD
ncbi:dicarboxylate/amino acid:cation symporter [Anaerolentibacter hominis]|uniref:dicarboxylate/amino acid:cation symporter n=1 Tax=Anaerolentibacter hominis TaxID=3079009 RepID=UPI0031B80729